jgi:Na+-driven multidrug efflux pump
MKETNSLTEGNVLKVLIKFAFPFVIANMIQALYGAVDLFVIGRYCNPESVAAVSTGTQVTQIITSMITGLTLGGTILAGKYTGMNDKEGVKKTIGTTLSVFAIVAVILTALMFVFTPGILRLLKTPEESFELAKTYVYLRL